ncbi:MAG: hypothetical protein OIF34_13405, partial [Porticoccaceae bacterium]|nr:hypothetical protein [Porticoccaceae bacterium]
TCSVLPQENNGLLEQALQTLPGARTVPLEASWGRATATGRQLFPQAQSQTQGHDGFYYALLQKTALQKTATPS